MSTLEPFPYPVATVSNFMDKCPQTTLTGVTRNGQTAIPRHLLQLWEPKQRSGSSIPKLKAAGTTFSLLLIDDYLVSTVFSCSYTYA
jgi:hypothetical protein